MREVEKLTLIELGRKIKETRLKLHMTQAKLAELIGVDTAHIWRIEKGINMSLVTYIRICRELPSVRITF